MADVIAKEVYIDNLLELEVRRCFETPGHRVCVIANCNEERNNILADVVFLIHKIHAEKDIEKTGQYNTLYRADNRIIFPSFGYLDINIPDELYLADYNHSIHSIQQNYYHSVLLCPDVTSFVKQRIENFLFPSFSTIAYMKSEPEPEPCPEETICDFLGITLNERTAE